MELKQRIEKVLSEILSDKYEAKITLRFVKVAENETYSNDRQKVWAINGSC